MKTIIVPPGERPRLEEIQSDLESLQKAVGGIIQVLYPFEDAIGIICNEEGKMIGLPLNRALRDESGNIYDVIAGTFLVAGLTEEDFGDLSSEQIEKYMKQFYSIEIFTRMGNEVLSFAV